MFITMLLLLLLLLFFIYFFYYYCYLTVSLLSKYAAKQLCTGMFQLVDIYHVQMR